MNRNSPPPGEFLAHGRTADVYAWEDGTVLKRFHNWFPRESIEYEARLAYAVHASGLPVPQPGDILDLDGATGLVYQRIYGQSMWQILQEKPWQLASFARLSAALQVQMHDLVFKADVPELHQRLEHKLERAAALSAGLRECCLEAVRSMPEGERICHGDFHPGNIIVTPQRELVVIDWIDAARGAPAADLARSSIIALGVAEAEDGLGQTTRWFVRTFHRIYLRHYFSLHPERQAEYRQWLPLVAAARLSEGIQELEPWLLAQAERGFPH